MFLLPLLNYNLHIIKLINLSVQFNEFYKCIHHVPIITINVQTIPISKTCLTSPYSPFPPHSRLWQQALMGFLSL